MTSPELKWSKRLILFCGVLDYMERIGELLKIYLKNQDMICIEQESLWLMDNGEVRFLVKYTIRKHLKPSPQRSKQC